MHRSATSKASGAASRWRVARRAGIAAAAAVCGPDSALLRAQQRAVERGGTLTREEEAKRD